MKRNSYFIYAIIIFLFCGCKKFLDVNPTPTQIIPTSSQDYDQLLNSPDLYYCGNDILTYGTDDVNFDSPQGQAIIGNSSWTSVANIYRQNAYLWAKEIYTANMTATQEFNWGPAYKRIFIYNQILNDAANVTGTEREKQRLIAEAKTGRAFEYLILVNTFAKSYDAGSADSDPGVPLPLKADITATNIPRASVKAVYQHILSDLQEATPMLPVTPVSVFRFSRAAGYGVLAKTALLMGNWSECRRYCDSVLSYNNKLYDLSQEYLRNYEINNATRHTIPLSWQNPENIFCRFVYGIGATAYTVSSLLFNNNQVSISNDLVNTYEADDNRKVMWFAKRYKTTATAAAGFVNLDHYIYTAYKPIINLGLAVPEVLLMRAESAVRMGGAENRQKAIDDLNTLRIKRILPAAYVPIDMPADDEAALILVLTERRRELALHPVRWFDLKRLNKDPRFAKTLERMLNGKKFILPADSKNYVYPIWANVLAFNSALVNNERDNIVGQ